MVSKVNFNLCNSKTSNGTFSPYINIKSLMVDLIKINVLTSNKEEWFRQTLTSISAGSLVSVPSSCLKIIVAISIFVVWNTTSINVFGSWKNIVILSWPFSGRVEKSKLDLVSDVGCGSLFVVVLISSIKSLVWHLLVVGTSVGSFTWIINVLLFVIKFYFMISLYTYLVV